MAPRKRSQSTVWGEASVGIEYCQAPIAELRLYRASIELIAPIAPAPIRALTLSYRTELAYWLPTWKTAPVCFWTAMTSGPSSTRRTMGFSQ